LTTLYWQIGNRIRQDILEEKRAEYGQEIVVTLSRQLSWSHFVEIIPFKDDLQRDFYARCAGWSGEETLGGKPCERQQRI